MKIFLPHIFFDHGPILKMKVSSPKKAVRIKAIVCENIEQSVLGYKDISKLNIVVDQSLIHRSWGGNRDMSQGDAQTIFDEIDADGNGEISEQELSEHKPPRRSR